MSKNFVLKNATSLSNEEMKNVRGGVSREEYCATLRTIVHSIQDSDRQLTDGEIEGAGHGWNVANCGEFFNDVSF